jgi:hypothetical protein
VIELRGSADLRLAAAQLKLADKRITEHIDRRIRAIGTRFGADVRDGIPRYMPGGYAPTLARTLQVSTSIRRRGRGVGIKLRVWAKGKTDERDVRALNAGALRHPLFGRRSKWYVTSTKPGFVDDPRRALADRAEDDLLAAVDEAIAIVTRG